MSTFFKALWHRMAGAMKENQTAKEWRAGGAVFKKEIRASFSEELTLTPAGWQEGLHHERSEWQT